MRIDDDVAFFRLYKKGRPKPPYIPDFSVARQQSAHTSDIYHEFFRCSPTAGLFIRHSLRVFQVSAHLIKLAYLQVLMYNIVINRGVRFRMHT